MAEDFLEHAEKTYQQAKNAMRRELETPVTPLTPEAREDAMKVAKEVWVEAMRFLGNKDEDVRRDPNNDALILESKKKLEKTIFRGADLGIDRWHHDYDTEAQAQHTRQELYTFYPDHVLKTTRNSSRSYGGETLAPRGLATEKHEANRDELRGLLEAVKASTQFRPSY